jgi:BirA family biotin operon repressor/biotin-[acetyl-CoA-carboxylase] ligase
MSIPEHALLRALLTQDAGWVSGETLAEKFGVSRVAVWQHFEKLRQAGYTLESQRSKGYRLVAPPNDVHAPLIDLLLKVRPRNFTFTVLNEVDSTNSEAVRELAADRATPFAIIARSQTKGRGRFGRAWHSEANGNLYITFAFRPRLEPARMTPFTLWMGLNLCEVIANFTQLSPGLKWPNDLLFNGRKAGGILTEARIDADQIRDLVFGVGVNVNSPAKNWPSDLGKSAVSLTELTGAPLDFNRLTAAIIGRMLLAYEKFTGGDYHDSFADLWHRYDVLRGKNVTVLEGKTRHTGLVTGVDDEGALLMRDARGRTQRFRAGEVTIEKSPAI